MNILISRRLAVMLCAAAVMALSAIPMPSALAGDMVHKVAIHVDDKDPKRINMALNNVVNIKKYYDSKGKKVQIEVVAYGPGLHMLVPTHLL